MCTCMHGCMMYECAPVCSYAQVPECRRQSLYFFLLTPSCCLRGSLGYLGAHSWACPLPHAWLFMWVQGSQTQSLKFMQQALHPLSVSPAPCMWLYSHCLILRLPFIKDSAIRFLFPTRDFLFKKIFFFKTLIKRKRSANWMQAADTQMSLGRRTAQHKYHCGLLQGSSNLDGSPNIRPQIPLSICPLHRDV